MKKKCEIDFNIIQPSYDKLSTKELVIKFRNSRKSFNLEFSDKEMRDYWFDHLEVVQSLTLK